MQPKRVATRVNLGHGGLSALACMAPKPEVMRAVEAPKDEIQRAIEASLATAEAEMLVEEELRKAIELSKTRVARCDSALAPSELQCPDLLEEIQRAIVAVRTDDQPSRMDRSEEEELARALALSAETYQQDARALGQQDVSPTSVHGTDLLAGDTAASSDVPMAKAVAAGLTTWRYWQEKHAEGLPLTMPRRELVRAVDTPDDLSQWWLEADLAPRVDVHLEGSLTLDDVLEPNLVALEEGAEDKEENEAWILV